GSFLWINFFCLFFLLSLFLFSSSRLSDPLSIVPFCLTLFSSTGVFSQLPDGRNECSNCGRRWRVPSSSQNQGIEISCSPLCSLLVHVPPLFPRRTQLLRVRERGLAVTLPHPPRPLESP